MKKIVLTLAILVSYFAKAQENSLLSANFWKNNPTIEQVNQEISKGNNPSEANRANYDVVSIAINNGASLETVLHLLKQPGNPINKVTHDGRIYLHWAASKGNVELIRYLIANGADVNKIDDKGATPITFAAGFGQQNTEVYDLFFKAGISPKQTYKDGANLIMLSIASDPELKLADYFIKKGIDIHAKDENGNTVFDYAARGGNVEILKKLKDRKVAHTSDAIVFAAQGGRFTSSKLDMYKYLIEELKINPASSIANGDNVLHYIVKKKDQNDIIEYFLNLNVDVEKPNKQGVTPFMSAAGSKEVKNFKHLLSVVRNIQTKTPNGENALVFAVESGDPVMVSELLEKGLDVYVQTEKGNLGYYLIQSYRTMRPGETRDEFKEKLDILKAANFDFTKPQHDGNTLLMLAVGKNNMQLVQKLENLGIDVNNVNKEGYTALHRAALIAKDTELLKELIKWGADKNIRTEFDETAYDLASENEYLKENKIDIEFLK